MTRSRQSKPQPPRIHGTPHTTLSFFQSFPPFSLPKQTTFHPGPPRNKQRGTGVPPVTPMPTKQRGTGVPPVTPMPNKKRGTGVPPVTPMPNMQRGTGVPPVTRIPNKQRGTGVPPVTPMPKPPLPNAPNRSPNPNGIASSRWHEGRQAARVSRAYLTPYGLETT